MGSKENHFKLYEKFKNDAENINNFEGTRVEAYFLSSYHLIESCAAQERVHINKHQHVRSILTKNEFIFRDKTEKIWKNFQKIENQFRPKFAYGFSWTKTDMKNVEVCYKKIEKICLKKLGETVNE
ncbi:hypothetical protein AYK20_03170 [Thermoplasmatales archaeon SG8-52-1]|nr:MAG: hypothetical protein AYK20_03170 [Thermoplasmatales archaeon SG8-52-1]